MADKMKILVNTIAPGWQHLEKYLEAMGHLPDIFTHASPLFIFPESHRSKGNENTAVIHMPHRPGTAPGRGLWNRRLKKKLHQSIYPVKYIGSYPLPFIPEAEQYILCLPQQVFYDQQNPKIRKKDFLKWAAKAYHWLVFSEYEKRLLAAAGNVHPEQISVIPPVYELPHGEAGDEEIERMKEAYASGHEYFIFYGLLGEGQNIISLLKAYSAFKKWSRSSFKMLLCGQPGPGFDQLKNSIDRYRFQKDVCLLPHLSPDKLRALLSGAYAAIFPREAAISGKELLHTLACHTPVIAVHDGVYPELAGKAALYFSEGSTVEMKEQMLRLFKEEQLRKILQQNIDETPLSFTSEKSMAALLALLNASRRSSF